MNRTGPMISALLALGMVACSAPTEPSQTVEQVAPGAPGVMPTWSNAEKVAIGTSYEAYDADGQFSDASPTAPISKVWFSLTKDRITEVMWGLIHEAQIREIEIVLVGPNGIVEPIETSLTLDGMPRPLSPAPGIGLFYPSIDQSVQFSTFTDPDRDSLIVKVDLLEPLPEGYQLFAYIDPALANTGSADQAKITANGIHAFEGDAHLFARLAGEAEATMSIGYVGESDGLADLADGALDQRHQLAEEPVNVACLIYLCFGEQSLLPGEPAVTTMLGYESTLVIGFGNTYDQAKQNADASASKNALNIYSKYADQWRTYLDSLTELARLSEVSGDGGRLAYMSAINLKIMEDKTHAGALIASLSNPWGETAPAETPQTGYKAVWPRDFFQVASAFVAMGDEDTARAAYRYLPTVQVTEDTPGNAGVTGWFLQKTHVDGEIEWVAIQQDQTAMPIMLGWKLWQDGVISDDEIAESYRTMLKPAADFLVEGGRPNILWNTEFEASLGYTQQERWEEQEGYSPSTVAAVISGLVTAADLATRFGDLSDAETYLAAADQLEANLENWMFTTSGDLGDGAYFIRITRNQDPNDKAMLGDNNGRPGLPEDHIVDGGFLELVRYGVRSPVAPSIQGSLEELDGAHEDNLRVRYEFGETSEGWNFIGWRRNGNAGSGEDGERGTNYHEIDGGNTPGQRGRVWPFFSGERAHYEMANLEHLLTRHSDNYPEVVAPRARIGDLVASMEVFANDGLSLPEQVWDNVGPNPFGYAFGEGSNSATPLAWTHAEYIKLLRSVSDQSVWDHYSIVANRYADSPRNLPAD
ncbi:MAG: glucan 1,4-alpha-glucosidase [Henriciella sp.]|nr:glucan 1,4-alpha-glucosidase [Henriciella sp.]